MPLQSYFFKFFVLFSSTILIIFTVWYFLVREESVDWVSSHVIHQSSPYAVTTTDDGKVIVDNVVLGYGFSLPAGFKTSGARNFSFFLEEDDQKLCAIRHYYLEMSRGSSTATKLVVPIKTGQLVFELAESAGEKADCAVYLKQIESSLITD